MADHERIQQGLEMRRRLMGEAHVDRMAKSVYTGPVMKKFLDLSSDIAFATVWRRPGLDLKTRTLITCISDTATGMLPELAIHLRMALRQGWTEDELVEAVLHLSVYVGLPHVRDALLTAERVFAEVKSDGGR